ncbi:MAG: hypothetical protein IJH39_07760 [Clostridia bacterium]|nr:hypothetical protein [Clostridia bacterium]
MKNVAEYIIEKLHLDKDIDVAPRTSLDDEMEVWDERMRSPFGKCLKELQCAVMELNTYATTKDEFGLSHYTPFDNYVSAYALDGNNKYTYEKIKSICDNYDYSQLSSIKKILKKLQKLV